MNKTVTANLAGLIFNLEEEAYQVIQAYLAAVRQNLDQEVDAPEIIADLESSLAEKFSEKISDSKQVITLAEVDELIEVLGQPEAFRSSESQAAAPSKNKKLYRNLDDMIIGGVCSGLALYFGVDPLLVRLLFILLFFTGGFAIPLYLILWIAIPAAKTNAQKLEMHGEALTLAALQKNSKEAVEKSGNRFRLALQRLLALPFLALKALRQIIEKIGRIILPILRIILGVCLSIGSLFGLGLATLFACLLFSNANAPYLISEIPVRELISLLPYYPIITAAYLSAIIPLIVVCLLGWSLIRKRNVLNFTVTASLIGVWMIALVALGTISLTYAPRLVDKVQKYPALQVVTKNLSLTDFEQIATVGQPLAVNIVQSPEFLVSVSGRNKDLDYLEVNQIEKELKIVRRPRTPDSNCLLCEEKVVTLTIGAPLLTVINNGGGVINLKDFSGKELTIAGAARGQTKISGNWQKFNAELSQNAHLSLNGNFPVINLQAKDDAVFTAEKITSNQTSLSLQDQTWAQVSGKLKILTVKAKNTSRLEALTAQIEKAAIDLQDDGNLKLKVEREISGQLADNSRLYYLSAPQLKLNIKQETAKAISIEKAQQTELSEETNEDSEEGDSHFIYLNGQRYRFTKISTSTPEFRIEKENFSQFYQ